MSRSGSLPGQRSSRASLAAGVLAAVVAITAALPRALEAETVASGQLLIQGQRLTLHEDDVQRTVSVGEPVAIRTCYAGVCGTPAAGAAGLTVAGDLTGPELPRAVTYTTLPGGTFLLPSFQTEGGYRLDNIRMVDAQGKVVSYSEPSTASFDVVQILVTTAEVRALTLAELQAKGISITQANFKAFNFAVGFFFAGQQVTLELPVLYKGPGAPEPIGVPTVVFPSGLPPATSALLKRWEPPTIIPFKLEVGSTGLTPSELDEGGGEPGVALGAIVIPGSLAYLHQFFDAQLVVANGAGATTGAVLRNVTGAVRLPAGDVLRLAATDPPVAVGQKVPVVVPGDGNTVGPGQHGSATWTVEGLVSGTHTLRVDINADLERPGRETVPLVGAAQAAVEVVDPRFHITFGHPDVVRDGEGYTFYVTVTNLSTALQPEVNLSLRNGLVGARPEDTDDTLLRKITDLQPGASETVEYRLVAQGVSGRCVGSVVQLGGEGNTGSVLLHAGVGELGVPLSPASLVLPRHTNLLPAALVQANVRLLGLAYGLAVAPAGVTPDGLPRVIGSDVRQRAYDLGEAGQRLFLKDGLLETLEVLALDQLGNRHPLAEYDGLRRALTKGNLASSALGDALRLQQQGQSLTALQLLDHLAATTSYLDAYAAALVTPAGAGAQPALELRRLDLSGTTFLAGTTDESPRYRSLPFGEVYSVSDIPGGAGRVPLALVGHLDPAASYRLRLHAGSQAAAGRVVALAPDPGGAGLVRVDFGEVALPAGQVYEVRLVRASSEGGLQDFALYHAGTGIPVSGLPPPTVTAVALPAFRLIGAVQDFRLSSSDPFGHAVSYLFNRPPSKASAESASHYRVLTSFHGLDTSSPPQVFDRSLEVVGAEAFQQASGRVVHVRFKNLISPLTGTHEGQPVVRHEHRLETWAIRDASGNTLDPAIPQVSTEAGHVGGLVDGKVVRGTGEGVAGARVQLIRTMPVGETGLAGGGHRPFITGEVTTDAEGRFFFPFVEEPSWTVVDRGYTLQAWVPAGPDPELAPAESESVQSYIRLDSRLQHVNIALLGRGTVTGRLVYASDSAPVAGGTVAVVNVVFGEGKGATAGADGRFTIPGVQVGTLNISGRDDAGNIAFATVGLERPGQTVDVELRLPRATQTVKRTGNVTGRILRQRAGQPAEPAPGAAVSISSEGGILGSTTADGTGAFRFEKVPAGTVILQAADFSISRSSVLLDVQLAADETADVTLTIPETAPRAVTGQVFFHEDVTNTDVPVAGAVVFIPGPGVFTYTDASGRYRLEGVPTQGVTDARYRLTAIDYTRMLQGTVTLSPVTDTGDPQQNEQPILAPSVLLRNLSGGVDGIVLDPQGHPAAQVGVVLGLLAETITGSDGRFRFDNVGVGEHTVTAHKGHGLLNGAVGHIGSARVKVYFGGHRPFVTVQMVGAGTVEIVTRGSAGPLLSQIALKPTYYEELIYAITGPGLGTRSIDRQTDADGRLSLTLPVGSFELTARHTPYGDLFRRGEIEYPGQVIRYDLAFPDFGTVVARVVDVDGVTPVPDAEVALHEAGALPRMQRTDAQGTFTFELVKQGGVTVTASAVVGSVQRYGSVYGPLDRPGQTLTLVVPLKAQGSVRGRIVERTASGLVALPGAQYYVVESAYPRRRFPASGYLVADGSGRFEIAGLSAGAISVVARDPGQVARIGRASGTITFDWQVLDLEAVLDDGRAVGSIELQVRDLETGAPVPDCIVTLSTGEVAVADALGVAGYEALPQGSYSAHAFHAPTGRSARTSGLTISAAGERVTRTLTLNERGEIGGTLYDDAARSVPVGNGEIVLRGRSLDGTDIAAIGRTSVASADLGQFLFGGLPLGSYTLDASIAASDRKGEAEVALTQTAPVSPPLAIVLEPVGDVYVRLYEKLRAGPREVDPAGGYFTLRLNGRVAIQPFAPYPNHLYRFTGVLLERGYSLSVDEASGELRTASAADSQLEGAGTQADPVRLVLRPKGVVLVQVRETGGAAVPAADVTLNGYRTATDDTGQARVDAVPAGDLYASAKKGTKGGTAKGALVYDDDVITLTITLAPAVSARGVVYQAVPGDVVTPASPRVPKADALVELTDANQLKHLVLTGEDGGYDFDGLPIGSYSIVAEDLEQTQEAQGQGVLAGPDGQLNLLPDLFLDGSGPKLLSIVPPSGLTGVSRTAAVEIVFSEPLSPLVLPAGASSPYFELRSSASGLLATGSWSASVNGEGQQVVRFVPSFPYEDFTTYSLKIQGGPNGVRDVVGKPVSAAFDLGSSFTTSDTVGPKIVAVTPSLARPVHPEATIRIDFSEVLTATQEMLDGDLDADAVELTWAQRDGAGNLVWQATPLPAVAFLTRGGYTLAVEQPTEFALTNDSLRRRLRVTRLLDAFGNVMAPTEPPLEYRIYDQNAPVISVGPPAGAPDGRVGSGSSYTLLPILTNLDDVTPQTPGGDIDRVVYYFPSTADPTVPAASPAIVSTAYPFGGTFTPTYSGNGTDPQPLSIWVEAKDTSTNTSNRVRVDLVVEPYRPPTVGAVTAAALAPVSGVPYAGSVLRATVTGVADPDSLQVTLSLELRRENAADPNALADLIVAAPGRLIAKPAGGWEALAPQVFDLPAMPLTLPEGTPLVVRARAIDPRGASAVAEARFSVADDTGRPAIEGLIARLATSSQPRSSFTIGQEIYLELRARDTETAVKTLSLGVDGGFSSPQAVSLVPGSGNLYRTAKLTVPPGIPQEGLAVTATATAVDHGENPAVSTLSFRLAPSADPTAPTLSWVSPWQGAVWPAAYTSVASASGVPLLLRVEARDTDVDGSGASVPGSIVLVEMRGPATASGQPAATWTSASLVPGTEGPGSGTYQLLWRVPNGVAEGTELVFEARVSDTGGHATTESIRVNTVRPRSVYERATAAVLPAETMLAAGGSAQGPVFLLDGSTLSLYPQTDGSIRRLPAIVLYAGGDLDGSGNLAVKPTALTAPEITSYESSILFYPLELEVEQLVAVASGARVDMSGRGLLGSDASRSMLLPGEAGAGVYAGGSHGGLGGVGRIESGTLAAPGSVHDSLRDPRLPGGGGGAGDDFFGVPRPAGGTGGGVVRLLAPAADVRIEGEITADARPATHGRSNWGGAAGGTIRVAARTLLGSGRLSASGGAAGPRQHDVLVGAGGGGRIALSAAEAVSASLTLEASGGAGQSTGGAGTIFTETIDAASGLPVGPGALLVANAAGTVADLTPLPGLAGAAVTAVDAVGSTLTLTAPAARGTLLGDRAVVHLADPEPQNERTWILPITGQQRLAGTAGTAGYQLALGVTDEAGALAEIAAAVAQGKAVTVHSRTSLASLQGRGAARIVADDDLEVGEGPALTLNDRASVTLDSQARALLRGEGPALTMDTNPAGGTEVLAGTRIALTYAANDPLAIISVERSATFAATSLTSYANDTVSVTHGVSPIEVTIPATSPAGSAALTLEVTNKAGRSTQGQKSWTVRANQKPTGTIGLPAGAPTTRKPSQTFIVNLHGDDAEALGSLSVQATGPATVVNPSAPFSGISADATFTFTVSPSAQVGNVITVTGIVTDREGQAVTLGSVTITVIENELPTGTLTVLNGASFLPGATVNARVQAQDTEGLNSIILRATGPAVPSSQAVPFNLFNATSYTWNPTVAVDFTAAAGATVALQAEIVDSYGNRVFTNTVNVTVLADTVAPSISSINLSPSKIGDLYTAGDVISVSLSGTDNVKVTYARISLAGQTVESTTVPASLTWTAPPVESTTPYVVDVELRDLAGNVKTGTKTFSVQKQINPAIPVVSFECPTSGAYLPSGYSALILKATGTDDVGVQRIEFYREAETTPFATATPSSGNPKSFTGSSTVTSLPTVTAETIARFRARVYDAAANYSESITEIRVVLPVDLDPTGVNNNWAALEDQLAILRSGTLTLDTPRTLGGLIVLKGATITHSATAVGNEKKLTVDVKGPFYVECDASIEANGKGYPAGIKYPGVTGTTTGGSHIGLGQSATTGTYGNVYTPAEQGSGGTSRAGGGVIRLMSRGTLMLDGFVRANGGDGTNAGAGGSVWMSAISEVAGSGTVEARGGDTGGGGGGAVAIEAPAVSTLVAARASARAGGTNLAGAGTVVVKTSATTYGDVTIAQPSTPAAFRAAELPALGQGLAQSGSGPGVLVTDRSADIPAYFVGTWVEVVGTDQVSKGTWQIASVTAKTANLQPKNGTPLAVSQGDTWRGVYHFDSFFADRTIIQGTTPLLVAKAQLGQHPAGGSTTTASIQPELRATGLVTIYGGKVNSVTAGDIDVKEGQLLPYGPGNSLQSITLHAEHTLSLGSTVVLLSGQGYPAGQTYPGETPPTGTAGGSHMGAGSPGSNGVAGSTFGSVYRPAEFGGGSSSFGGGVLRLKASTLLLGQNTQINANGNTAAGGSIWITADSIEGDGQLIHANGLSTGGGGAVAVEYGNATGLWLSRLQARSTNGNNGTIYLKGPQSTYGELRVEGNCTAAELPSLGGGQAASGSGSNALVTDRTANIPAYFAGGFARLTPAGGSESIWRIATVNAKTATFDPAGGQTPTVASGDAWQGVYRFDKVSVSSCATLISRDPIVLTDPGSAPTAAIALAAGQATDLLPGASATFSLTGAYSPGIGRVVLRAIGPVTNGATTQTVNGATTFTGSMAVTILQTAAANQTVTVWAEVYGTDGSYARSTDVLTLRVVADTVAPVFGPVTLTPLNQDGTVSGGTTETIDVAVSDNVGVTSVTFQVGSTTLTDSAAPFQFTWTPAPTTTPVNVNLVFTARDLANNTTSFTREATIVQADSGALPTAKFTCPSSAVKVPAGRTIRLWGSASDDSGVVKLELYKDAATTPFHTVNASNYTTTTLSFTTTVTLASTPGTVVYKVVAYDVGLRTTETTLTLSIVSAVAINVSNPDWAALATTPGYVASGQTLVVDQKRTVAGLFVLSGGKVTHSAATATAQFGLDLEVTGEMWVECGGSVDVAGRGYLGGANSSSSAGTWSPTGPTTSGGSTKGAGGSHGGPGGIGASGYQLAKTYGNLYRPSMPGSGGASSPTIAGTGKSGGGVVHLTAPTLTVDGTVDASGGASGQGGGAGGSVLLDAGTIQGSGIVKADGSIGSFGAGGGGGRIAAHVANAGGMKVIGTQFSARSEVGASGFGTGGPGTILLFRKAGSDASVYGDLIVDTGTITSATSTAMPSLGTGSVESWDGASKLTDTKATIDYDVVGSFVELTDGTTDEVKGLYPLQGYGTGDGKWSSGNRTLVIGTTGLPAPSVGDRYQGVTPVDTLTIRGNVTISSRNRLDIGTATGQEFAVDGRTLAIDAPIGVPSLRLKNNATLTTPSPTTANAYGLDLRVSGNVTIEAGSVIDLSRKGYLGANQNGHTGWEGMTWGTNGPTGTGGSAPGAGGSHGGRGAPYGSNQPSATFGSVYFAGTSGAGAGGAGGTQGGSGGGRLRLRAASLTLHGDVRADGEAVGSGGAGGSVLVEVGTISGTGTITTVGAASTAPNVGGGGGRIALSVGTSAGLGISLSQLRAWGGASTVASGGAGTIYVKTPSGPFGDLIVDNNGVSGQPTILPALGSGTALSGSTGTKLVTNKSSIPDYFIGHWIEIRDASQTLKGYWRVRSISGAQITLASNEGVSADVVPGDLWKGIYRFDSSLVRNGATLQSTDPIPGAPPTVAITAPAPGASVRSHSPLTVQFTSSDDYQVARVVVALGSASTQVNLPPSTASASLTVPGVTVAGTMNLTVTAFDAAGQSTTASVPIDVVPNAVPVTSSLSIDPSPVVAGDAFVVSAHVSDDETLSRAVITVSGAVSDTRTVTLSGTSADISESFPTSAANLGNLNVSVVAFDQYDAASTPVTASTQAISAAPAISGVLICPSSRLSPGSPFEVCADAVVPRGASSYRLTVTGALSLDITGTSPCFTGLSAPSGTSGAATAVVTLIDTQGQTASGSAALLVAAVLDNRIPVVEGITPEPESALFTGQTVRIAAKAFDDVAVSGVTVDVGGTPQTVVTIGDRYEAVYTVPAGLEGQELGVTIRAADAAGNQAVESFAYRVLSPDLPDVAFLCPSDGATVPLGIPFPVRVTASGRLPIDHVDLYLDAETAPIAQTTLQDGVYVATVTLPSGAPDYTIMTLRARATDTGGHASEITTTLRVVTAIEVSSDRYVAWEDTSLNGRSVVVTGGTLTLQYGRNFRDLIVLDGARVTGNTDDYWFGLEATGAIYVACGGTVDANGLGYRGGLADGNTSEMGEGVNSVPSTPAGAGGSHGGRGGGREGHRAFRGAPTYGSPVYSDEGGSGGGGFAGSGAHGGRGGGVFWSDATLVVDGVVSANGGLPSGDGAGGGSGGSVVLEGSASGTGRFVADGAGAHHPGGGGRITMSSPGAGLVLSAAGGRDPQVGERAGAGTIFRPAGALYPPSGPLGSFVIDNGSTAKGLGSLGHAGLPRVGTGTVTWVSGKRIADSSASWKYFIEGAYVRILRAGSEVGRYQVLAAFSDGETLELEDAAIGKIQVGDTYVGQWRFTEIDVTRNAHLDTDDEIEAPVIHVDATSTLRSANLFYGASPTVGCEPSTPDAPPVVSVVSPVADQTFAPGASIPLSIASSDDHHVDRIVVSIGATSIQVTSPGALESASITAPSLQRAERMVLSVTAVDDRGQTTTVQVPLLVSSGGGSRRRGE